MYKNISTKNSVTIAAILLLATFLLIDENATHNLGGFQNVTRSSILASNI